MREARLVIKDGKAFLKVVFEKKEESVEAKESTAVDINMSEIVVSKDELIMLGSQPALRRFTT
jgi:hypothetical protein